MAAAEGRTAKPRPCLTSTTTGHSAVDWLADRSGNVEGLGLLRMFSDIGEKLGRRREPLRAARAGREALLRGEQEVQLALALFGRARGVLSFGEVDEAEQLDGLVVDGLNLLQASGDALPQAAAIGQCGHTNLDGRRRIACREEVEDARTTPPFGLNGAVSGFFRRLHIEVRVETPNSVHAP